MGAALRYLSKNESPIYLQPVSNGFLLEAAYHEGFGWLFQILWVQWQSLLDWSLGIWRASSCWHQVFLRVSSHSFLPTGDKDLLAAVSRGYSFLGTPKHAQRGMKRKRSPCMFTGPHKETAQTSTRAFTFVPPTLHCSVLLCKAPITFLQHRAGVTPWISHCIHFWAGQVFGGKTGKSQHGQEIFHSPAWWLLPAHLRNKWSLWLFFFLVLSQPVMNLNTSGLTVSPTKMHFKADVLCKPSACWKTQE